MELIWATRQTAKWLANCPNNDKYPLPWLPTAVYLLHVQDLHLQENTFGITYFVTNSIFKGVHLTRDEFLEDPQGKTFIDVVNDAEQPFAELLEFLNDPDRQRRMEESELHHDRAPLAGVVRELESQPGVDKFLREVQTKRNTRFRQAVGVMVRIIMERRGWQKTGRKGSLGVRAAGGTKTAAHNTGGLAFWFVRAERYQLPGGMPYQSVRRQCEDIESGANRANAGQ